jgi:alanine-synthesizing transaminase
VRSDEELAISLIEKEDVLVQPGYFYDFYSEGFMVISLITPEAVFQEGLKRMLRYLD